MQSAVLIIATSNDFHKIPKEISPFQMNLKFTLRTRNPRTEIGSMGQGLDHFGLFGPRTEWFLDPCSWSYRMVYMNAIVRCNHYELELYAVFYLCCIDVAVSVFLCFWGLMVERGSFLRPFSRLTTINQKNYAKDTRHIHSPYSP